MQTSVRQFLGTRYNVSFWIDLNKFTLWESGLKNGPKNSHFGFFRDFFLREFCKAKIVIVFIYPLYIIYMAIYEIIWNLCSVNFINSYHFSNQLTSTVVSLFQFDTHLVISSGIVWRSSLHLRSSLYWMFCIVWTLYTHFAQMESALWPVLIKLIWNTNLRMVRLSRDRDDVIWIQ